MLTIIRFNITLKNLDMNSKPVKWNHILIASSGNIQIQFFFQNFIEIYFLIKILLKSYEKSGNIFLFANKFKFKPLKVHICTFLIAL